MFSKFFIDRPIFASVLSIIITLAGFLAIFSLPMAQYPEITPPTIMVACKYPGASAQVVAETVAAPIEQKVNGVENMLYMSSQCTNDGSYTLTVSFEPGVKLNFAQVLVQNRVNLALPLLPQVVKQTGITTRKRSPDILMFVSLYSPDGSRDNLYLSNYANLYLRDELARLDGLGDVGLFGGQDYSMRVWVDPGKLASYSMTAGDVARALREQNMQIPAGHVGQQPVPPGQEFQLTLMTLGRLNDAEQFAEVVLKHTSDGRVVRIKDVGRVELGPKNFDVVARFDGQPVVNLACFQLPDANALDCADRIRAKMSELAQYFPPGIAFDTAYDTTPFIRESVREVIRTLLLAVVLVATVVLVFLQNWRTALIPLIAVPVAIIGTFAAMALIGFTINNLTLFGLVLAIGIVVDDAIVVVEAVEHHIELGMKPRAATIRAMELVSSPVIAVAFVLCAVFVPCAFITGVIGAFFRQFALTIAVSTVLSCFNSLTLSPALAALLLKPRRKGNYAPLPWLIYVILGGWAAVELLGPRVRPLLDPTLEMLAGKLPFPFQAFLHRYDLLHYCAPGLLALLGGLHGALLSWPINQVLRQAFRLFNYGFALTRTAYLRLVGLALRGCAAVLVVYGCLIALTGLGMSRLPVGYIPTQDMGYLLAAIQLPDSSALERTRAVVEKVTEILRETDADQKNIYGIKNVIGVWGQSFVIQAFGSNFGQMFIVLEDFHTRAARGLHSEVIAQLLRQKIAREVPEAMVMIFSPPPVRGLGTAGGFKFVVEDRGDLGLDALQRETSNLLFQGNKTRSLTGLMTVYRANSPQLFVDINRDQCQMLGVPINDVYSTLQIYLGSLYVNDFNKFGRTWQVIIQCESEYRDQVEDVKRLMVRNKHRQMVPLGSLARVRDINGPLILTRYNMYPAAAINGNTLPGVSSGDGIKIMEDLADQELPWGMTYEWTEIAYMQILAGNTAWKIFALAVLGAFLVLAALYESWSLPLAVILVVPVCLLGPVIGVYVTRSDINIFTQVGFVVLVGLASKNAILIVEFAKGRRAEGVPRFQATLAACQLRFRPIMMTSFAFILGVVPLLIGKGAGAEMRRVLGTAVFSGMLGVTFFGILLTPVFFSVINRLSESPVFASRTMQIVGWAVYWTFVLLTFGLAWLLPQLLQIMTRRPVPPQQR